MKRPRTHQRNAATIAFGAMILGSTAARAHDAPERVCALPEVLRTVTLELHRRGIDGDIDVRNPGQRSLDGPRTACSVWLRRRFYDTSLYGGVPQYRVDVQTFEVRRHEHSLSVELTD